MGAGASAVSAIKEASPEDLTAAVAELSEEEKADVEAKLAEQRKKVPERDGVAPDGGGRAAACQLTVVPSAPTTPHVAARDGAVVGVGGGTWSRREFGNA